MGSSDSPTSAIPSVDPRDPRRIFGGRPRTSGRRASSAAPRTGSVPKVHIENRDSCRHPYPRCRRDSIPWSIPYTEAAHAAFDPLRPGPRPFETIHPFLDGNGRVGRLLITFLLCQQGRRTTPVVPELLPEGPPQRVLRPTGFRAAGRRLGGLAAVLSAGRSRSEPIGKQHGPGNFEHAGQHRQAIAERGAGGARARLLDYLFEQPIVTIRMVEKKLQCSYVTANRPVDQLVELKFCRKLQGSNAIAAIATNRTWRFLRRRPHQLSSTRTSRTITGILKADFVPRRAVAWRVRAFTPVFVVGDRGPCFSTGKSSSFPLPRPFRGPTAAEGGGRSPEGLLLERIRPTRARARAYYACCGNDHEWPSLGTETA